MTCAPVSIRSFGHACHIHMYSFFLTFQVESVLGSYSGKWFETVPVRSCWFPCPSGMLWPKIVLKPSLRLWRFTVVDQLGLFSVLSKSRSLSGFQPVPQFC